ncbi:DNA damage-induced apoptosis suppressor protein isoform X2 [Melanerpes formicivorus]|uniref:DNA damage-induced apoptosis suppressor protein isoform X2 n=1 Tax=Melanerpes formicivorus TaxID=211600 RepID=UPI00358ED0DC
MLEGEAKDASYRYRLSLKVADTDDLFDITVFGSCLDPFFGVTAEKLQRCIQDFKQLSGGTHTDAPPGVLAQAVEACFVGKRFLFGVKGSAREDGGHPAASSILQSCSRINRSTKTLTACQLFLPAAAVAGFTVISCFHRLLRSACSAHGSPALPDASSAPTDEPASELSSCSGLSSDSCLVQSSARESFLGPWQRSFSLTSSVAWVTAEDFPALEVGKLGSEQHEQEGRPLSAELCSVSPNNQTLLDPQLFSSSVKEGNREEDDESSLQPGQTDSLSAADELELASSSKTESSLGSSSRWSQHPSQFGLRSIYPKANSRNYSCPEKSHSSLLPERDSSAPNHTKVAGVAWVDSELWDELPFSESLNEFLARIEEGKSAGNSPSLGAGRQALLGSCELGVNLGRSRSRQTPVAGDLPQESVSGRFLPPAESDSWENILLACCQSNGNALSDDVSQCESSSSASSSADRERGASSIIPAPHLPGLSPSLPVLSKPPVSESRSVQAKASLGISKSAWPFVSLQCTAEEGESSCLKRSKAATSVLSAHESCSAGCANKEDSSPPSQRAELTDTGAWDFDPPSNTRRTYKRKLKALTELSENVFRNVKRRELLWNSILPEGSYNASAELFDASAREGAQPGESLNKSCTSLTEEETLTEKVTPPELVLYPGDGLWKSSSLSPSLHRSPAFSKHSTPVPYSFCDPECSSVTTQDLVPYSQSTPMRKPLQKLWPVAERSSSVTSFTPKNPTKLHSKCKRCRSSFQNSLLQQLTGRLAKRERPSSREDRESYSSASQQFPNSQPPAGFGGCIPPPASSRSRTSASSNPKAVCWAAALQLSCGHGSRSPVAESKESSGGAAGCPPQGLSPGDTARVLTAPVSAGATRPSSLQGTALDMCSPSAGRSLLPGTNCPGGALEGATGWSPELFF